jgi:hypothetical protein
VCETGGEGGRGEGVKYEAVIDVSVLGDNSGEKVCRCNVQVHVVYRGKEGQTGVTDIVGVHICMHALRDRNTSSCGRLRRVWGCGGAW